MRIMRGMVGGFSRLDRDLDTAMKYAIELQAKHRIEIVCDGDQRGDMISYFAQDIPGLGVEDGRPLVKGKVTPPEEPEKVKKVSDFFRLRELYPDLKFKVSMAGPTTLAMSCGSRKIVGGYRNYVDFSLAEDLTEALRAIIKPLAEEHVLIQIDEPFFSQGFRDLGERVSLVDRLLEGCDPEKCSIHVCGFIGRQPLLRELARLENLKTISHAFSIARDRERENIDILEKSIFEEWDKQLAAGIVSVSPRELSEVESPETICGRLEQIAGKIGAERIAYVTPDCYMRAIDPVLAEAILVNLDEGAKRFEESDG